MVMRIQYNRQFADSWSFQVLQFFKENMELLFHTFGIQLDWVTLDILLPVGISFYTFQALSYTIDVYKKKLEPTHDIVAFLPLSVFPSISGWPHRKSDEPITSVL